MAAKELWFVVGERSNTVLPSSCRTIVFRSAFLALSECLALGSGPPSSLS